MDSPAEYDLPALRQALQDQLQAMGADCYPAQIERLFPRILARIVEQWGKPELDHFLDELMVPERPGRQGFPADVAMEIFRLSTLHASLGFQAVQSGTGWAGVNDAELYRKAIKKHI